ncbi:MAG: thioesterase family protein [Alphaproteobacteria bacterium]|nr:thioesterase family protein [Alphaproteobacteria bacterium]
MKNETPPARPVAFDLDRSMTFSWQDAGRFLSETSPLYANSFGPYGGWIAGFLAKAMLAQEPQGTLQAFTVNFLGSCEDGPLKGSVNLLRRNRTNEFWTADFSDKSNPVAHAIATFGIRRPTLRIGDIAPPAPAPDPSEATPRPIVAGMPAFFQRYDARLFDFKIFQVNPTADTRMWIRDSDRRPLDIVSLICHADAPIPRIFVKTDRPTPIATMTMTVYVAASPEEIAAVGDDYILIDSNCRFGRDGFFDQVSRLWTQNGQLLATTEQLVWYKAAAV